MPHFHVSATKNHHNHNRAAVEKLFTTLAAETFPPLNPLWQPAARLVKKDEDYILTLEAPGYDSDSISVNILDDIVTVSATPPTAPDRADNESVIFDEMRNRKFTREFKIGVPVDAEKVTANYTDGILTITFVSLALRTTPTRVPVTHTPTASTPILQAEEDEKGNTTTE